jgi:hypothetical protein
MRWGVVAALTVLVASRAGQIAGVELHASNGLPDRHRIDGAGRCLLQLVELQPVKARFQPIEVPSRPTGWETPHEAALAFYEFHDSPYQSTDETTELVGFVLRSAKDRYFFTTAASVPFAFELTARIARPRGWSVGSLLHTHPGGRDCQEEFSIEDRDAVLRGAVPGSYLRTPLGSVRFLDRRLAAATSFRRGARGVSVCAGDAPCLAPHKRATGAAAYASR